MMNLIGPIPGTLICLTVSVILSALAYYWLPSSVAKIQISSVLRKRIALLLAPITTIVFLAIYSAYLIQNNHPVDWIKTPIRLCFIWLIITIILFSKKKFFIAWLGLVLISLITLNLFNLYDPTIALLTQYSLNIGKTHLSLYTLLKSIIILSILFWTIQTVSKSTKHQIEKSIRIKSNTKEIFYKLIDITLYAFLFILALNLLSIDLTAFAIIGGAVGVGVGFGLQKITSNFISGLILVFERSIEIGDVVELEDGILGKVKRLGMRYTVVESFDGKEIMIPNEEFITKRVNSWTYSNPKARVEIDIGVSYDADLEKAQSLLLEAATEHPDCLKDPSPCCYITSFGDNSVNFWLAFWISDVADVGRVEPKNDVMFAIWRKFKANNISIPYPQRDIHIKTSLPSTQLNQPGKPI